MNKILPDFDIRQRALRGEPSSMTLDEARNYLRSLGWNELRLFLDEQNREKNIKLN